MAPVGMVDMLGWFSSPEVGVISLIVFLVLSITLVALCIRCNSKLMGAQGPVEPLTMGLVTPQIGGTTNCLQAHSIDLRHTPTNQPVTVLNAKPHSYTSHHRPQRFQISKARIRNEDKSLSPSHCIIVIVKTCTGTVLIIHLSTSESESVKIKIQD